MPVIDWQMRQNVPSVQEDTIVMYKDYLPLLEYVKLDITVYLVSFNVKKKYGKNAWIQMVIFTKLYGLYYL